LALFKQIFGGFGKEKIYRFARREGLKEGEDGVKL